MRQNELADFVDRLLALRQNLREDVPHVNHVFPYFEFDRHARLLRNFG